MLRDAGCGNPQMPSPFRSPHINIFQATADFEPWLAKRLPIVREDTALRLAESARGITPRAAHRSGHGRDRAAARAPCPEKDPVTFPRAPRLIFRFTSQLVLRLFAVDHTRTAKCPELLCLAQALLTPG